LPTGFPNTASVERTDSMAAKPTIECKPDGPYLMALCRCGASRNKPFCDGGHWGVGFKD